MSKRPKADKPKRIRPDRIPEGRTLARLQRVRVAITLLIYAVRRGWNDEKPPACYEPAAAGLEQLKVIVSGVCNVALQNAVDVAVQDVLPRMKQWLSGKPGHLFGLSAEVAVALARVDGCLMAVEHELKRQMEVSNNTKIPKVYQQAVLGAFRDGLNWKLRLTVYGVLRGLGASDGRAPRIRNVLGELVNDYGWLRREGTDGKGRTYFAIEPGGQRAWRRRNDAESR